MIALEDIKSFKLRDIISIIGLLILQIIILYSAKNKLTPQSLFIFSIVLYGFFVSLLVLFIRKSGTALLFFITSSILTYNLNDLGITGINKFLILLFSAILFELIFLILKIELKRIPLDILLANSFSLSLIPISTFILLSTKMLYSEIYAFFNLIILCLMLGIISNIFAFLIWYTIKDTKFGLKYRLP